MNLRTLVHEETRDGHFKRLRGKLEVQQYICEVQHVASPVEFHLFSHRINTCTLSNTLKLLQGALTESVRLKQSE